MARIQPTLSPNPRERLCYIESLRKNPYRIASRGGLQWLECPALARWGWLVHAFSTRHGGVTRGIARGLNLGFIESASRANVEKNRKRFLAAIGAEDFSLLTLRQVHSTNIFRVVRDDEGAIRYFPAGSPAPQALGGKIPVGDALVTDQPGILLSVRTADCLPILIIDPRHRAIAALHAGWRGALERLAEKVAGVMRAVFKSDPTQVIAVIGPGIRACCYGVGEEVISAFNGRFMGPERFFRPVPASDLASRLKAGHSRQSLARDPPGRAAEKSPATHLDLTAAVCDQLHEAGLRPGRIHDLGLCTACRTDWFYSHRREGPTTGRMMAIIGIKPGDRS